MLIPYIAPSKLYQKESIVKKSRFIAFIAPVKAEEECEIFLQSVKKSHPEASHRCFAFRIGAAAPIRERSGDDGEPQGTAGHPMLHVLQTKDLTNTVAVIVRYFGGIKLGTGGLARVYGNALTEAVNNAPLVRHTPHHQVVLTLPYSYMGSFEHAVGGTDIRITDRRFTHVVTVSLLCPTRQTDRYKRLFADMTGGRADFSVQDECYVPLPIPQK